MQDFDTYWDYSNPKSTEEKFREILLSNDVQDPNYRAELSTQLARTMGMQRKFTEAHNLLNQITPDIIANDPQVACRLSLERGRLYNSNNEKPQAIEHFIKAAEIAQVNHFDFYLVDAYHMLGIATKAEDSLEWNEKAITAAESATEARAKNWLGALYNNTGWTYLDMKEYEKAADLFHKCLYWNEDKKKTAAVRIAKYSIAKCYRLLNRNEEALFILTEIVGDDDGYIHEELAENYVVINEPELAKEHFKMAYDLLSSDIWLQANEKSRIDRWQSFL